MSERKRAEKLIALAQPLSDYTDQRLLGEGVWAAKALLEALDTIDKAKALHQYEQKWGGVCGECESRWPCPTWQALNGSNESGAGR